MISTIRNQYLEVSVKSFGAEMSSIKSINDGFEYLWQGDARYWSGQSPVLFPIVGKIENGKYKYQGQEYELDTHGFAKSSEFKLVDEAPERLTYTLSSCEETLKHYPFNFDLIISYQLVKNAIRTEYKLNNTDSKTLWFSIGAHPAFNCPFNTDEQMEDYVLEFSQDENVNRILVEEGFLSGKEEVFLNGQKRVSLSHNLFDRLAIILRGLKSEYVTLKSQKNKRKVTVTLKGFPYFGIWSPIGDAPFICIEPCYGVTGTKGTCTDITMKEGIMSLEPGKQFICSFDIIIE